MIHANAATKPCLIVAHRGASFDAPENTLPAFKLAWEQGADAIEGDFQLTHDGEIVCIHDDTTERVSGAQLNVAQSSLQALSALDVGSYFSTDCLDTRIPRLVDVLNTVPRGKAIYIEIKCGVEIIVPLLDTLATSALTPSQCVVIAFDAEVIQALKSTAPQYRAFYLYEFAEHSNAQQAPEESIDDLLNTLQHCAADGLSTNTYGLSREFIQAIINAGYSYHVWTVDDVDEAKRLVSWGVSSITTNRPAALLSALT